MQPKSVKAAKAKALGTKKEEPRLVCLELADGLKQMREIVKYQLHRIEHNIWNIIRYLVRALLKPNSQSSLMPDSQMPGMSNYYYVMVTIWYVAWNFPKWDWSWKEAINTSGWHFENSALFRHLPSDNWALDLVEGEKLPLLRWYHYGAILLLSQKNGMLPDSWKEGRALGGTTLEAKVHKLAKAAKIAAAAKLSSTRPYNAEDEIIDRLSFLSDELGLEPRRPRRVGTIASLTMKRIKEREHTRALNPGWLSHMEEGFVSGPWEIHALCHHSRLVVLSLEEKNPDTKRSTRLTPEEREQEISTYKSKIYQFLNSEGTLVPCWERAHTKARKGWLRSEATAVLASTLLMLNEMDMKNKLAGDAATSPGSGEVEERGSGQEDELGSDAKDPGDDIHQVVVRQGTVLREIRYMEFIMQAQRASLNRMTGEAVHQPIVDWKTFSTPRRYHPPSFFNSLEDTPELYGLRHLMSTTIPASLHNSATSPGELKEEFDYNYLTRVAKFFRLFDITATGPDHDSEGYTWETMRYNYDGGNADLVEGICGEILENCKLIQKSQDAGEVKRLEDENMKRKAERRLLNRPNKDICWALYDSPVDQEVQHRFLAVRSPAVPRSLLDCLRSMPARPGTAGTNRTPSRTGSWQRLTKTGTSRAEHVRMLLNPARVRSAGALSRPRGKKGDTLGSTAECIQDWLKKAVEAVDSPKMKQEQEKLADVDLQALLDKLEPTTNNATDQVGKELKHLIGFVKGQKSIGPLPFIQLLVRLRGAADDDTKKTIDRLEKFMESAQSRPQAGDLRGVRDLLERGRPIKHSGQKTSDGEENSVAALNALREFLLRHKYLGPELSRELLDLLVYVLHPEAAACLGNHVLRFSRFSYQERDGWVANITLRSWRVPHRGPPLEKPTQEGVDNGTLRTQLNRLLSSGGSPPGERAAPAREGGSHRFTDDGPIYLPPTLKEVWGGRRMVTQEKLPLDVLSFELDVSSICLSTNPFGDFSKCLITSELLDDGDLAAIVDDARKLWQKFIHQPQTARCLVFLLILGQLCQKVTQNYEDAMKELTALLDLNVSSAGL